MSRTTTSLAAIAAIAALGLAACSSGATSSSQSTTSSASEATQASSVSIEANDGHGRHQAARHPRSIPRQPHLEVLAQWDVPLVAVPKKLIPSTITAYNGDDIADVGMHRDPNLEALVAAEPDLIISGQRFSKYDAQIKELAPDVPLINLEPREGQPFDQELIREVTDLGEIFGKQDEAKKLVATSTPPLSVRRRPTTAPQPSWPLTSPAATSATWPRARAAPGARSSTCSA